MPADFPSLQTAAPPLEKAAPASASLQTASCQYVYKRYEELGDAMTAHVITYQGKSAAREVGKTGSKCRLRTLLCPYCAQISLSL
jgi:hypothetical protein